MAAPAVLHMERRYAKRPLGAQEVGLDDHPAVQRAADRAGLFARGGIRIDRVPILVQHERGAGEAIAPDLGNAGQINIFLAGVACRGHPAEDRFLRLDLGYDLQAVRIDGDQDLPLAA